jgi:peroxin-7
MPKADLHHLPPSIVKPILRSPPDKIARALRNSSRRRLAAMASMLEFRTPGFNPYAVKYSPYYDSRLAVAASAHYGIVGNGRLFVLGLGPGGIQLERAFETNDAQYDLVWSEINENQLLVACGDGSLKLFDLAAGDFPIMSFSEHKREAFSVCWNPITKDSFISSSWDGTVKIVRPSRLLFPSQVGRGHEPSETC